MRGITNKIILCAALAFVMAVNGATVFAQENAPCVDSNHCCSKSEIVLPDSEKEKPELLLGTDIVSSYVWRGVYQGAGPSIQPYLGVWYKGLSLAAWGSSDFVDGFKEINIILAYEFKGFELSVTDNWWEGQGSPFFKDYLSVHSLEAAIRYTISDDFPLTIGWHTFIAGEQDTDEETGKRNFSTAITLGYDFYLKNDYLLNASIVVSPWASPIWLPVADYRTSNFQVAAIQLTASKDIKISQNFSLPVSLSVIASPATDDVHFVAALNF